MSNEVTIEIGWKELGFATASILLCAAIMTSGGKHYDHSSPGVHAPKEPRQYQVENPSPIFKDGYMIMPVANFEVEARVLSTESYRFDRGSDLSPVDLAMGWGRMSDPTILENFDISQGGRFYYWRVKQYPIPRDEIISHSANMHMIPADDSIAKKLKEIEEGDIAKIKGYLVQISHQDGFRWNSSMTRNDSGAGACEVIWVTSAEIS